MGNFPFVAVLVCLFVLQPALAHAYIDPGTGSVLLQALMGIAVAVFMTVRIFWARIKVFFLKRMKTDDQLET